MILFTFKAECFESGKENGRSGYAAFAILGGSGMQRVSFDAVKEPNAAWRNSGRKDCHVFIGYQYDCDRIILVNRNLLKNSIKQNGDHIS